MEGPVLVGAIGTGPGSSAEDAVGRAAGRPKLAKEGSEGNDRRNQGTPNEEVSIQAYQDRLLGPSPRGRLCRGVEHGRVEEGEVPEAGRETGVVGVGGLLLPFLARSVL